MAPRNLLFFGILAGVFAVVRFGAGPDRAPVRAVSADAPAKPAAKRYAEVACRDEIGSFADWSSLRAGFMDRELQRVLLSEKRAFDFKDLCPNYDRFENKIDFWSDLLKEIAGHASGFRPLEATGDPADRERVARGLFQIDELSSRRYRCDLRGLEPRCALHDPRVAAGCAIKIVNELAVSNRQVSKNLAERWGALRQRREIHAAFGKNESCARPKARRYEALNGSQTAWVSPRFQRPAATQRTAREN